MCIINLGLTANNNNKKFIKMKKIIFTCITISILGIIIFVIENFRDNVNFAYYALLTSGIFAWIAIFTKALQYVRKCNNSL